VKLADALFLKQPWLITPEAHAAMVAAAQSFFSTPPAQIQPEPLSPLLAVENGVGIVTIDGPIIRKPDLISQILFGATDTDEIIAAVNEAGTRPDVKAVFLDIDSPGGGVNGTPELAQAVADVSKAKYVYAFSAGLMCSGAYWVASQADAIYVTPSARVGSIGVILPVIDTSESLRNNGIKVEVFAAGKYKCAGTPGVPLTDEQRAWLQAGVEEIAADFHAAVLARGRKIPAEAMEGQTFSARNAMRFNLSGIMKSRDEALRTLRDRHVPGAAS
jgi:signal peptide peptidase SppA